MTIKKMAFATQQHLQANTGINVKRTHTYELLAASFGFNSYAALNADWVFIEQVTHSRNPNKQRDAIGHRCLGLGYPAEVALRLAEQLTIHLSSQKIGVIKLDNLISHLSNLFDDDEDTDEFDVVDFDKEELSSFPLLISGLQAVAATNHPKAHYALALIYRPSDDDSNVIGIDYWYIQANKGAALSTVQQEWADTYSAKLIRDANYKSHLIQAAKLGHQSAKLELAENFGDTTLFESITPESSDLDPIHVADIAEQIGRYIDARRWLTLAAKKGDTEAMCRLIKDYDRHDLQQCWVWMHLGRLLGEDLADNNYEAIHENGRFYDDEIGGPIFVLGDDGIHLEAISAEKDVIARNTAEAIFKLI